MFNFSTFTEKEKKFSKKTKVVKEDSNPIWEDSFDLYSFSFLLSLVLNLFFSFGYLHSEIPEEMSMIHFKVVSVNKLSKNEVLDSFFLDFRSDFKEGYLKSPDCEGGEIYVV